MRFSIIVCFIWSLSSSVMAFTQEDFLRSLEKMGEWQTAYPLALQVAQQKNTYEAWRDVALKYQSFDKDGMAYLRAWQQAHQRKDIEVYKNFMSLRPQAELNIHAIHMIYQLTEKIGSVAAYREFVEQFPGAIEAIDALLKMQRLFFEEVKKENTSDAYDAFVVFFPQAEQAPDAIQASYNLEKQTLEQEIHSLDCRKEGEEKRICEMEAKERIARKLFNDARKAEIESKKSLSENEKMESEARKTRFSLMSARKYDILMNSHLFDETKVLTENLDRDERFAFQNQLLEKQKEIKSAIDDMKTAVVAAIKEQTGILGGKLDTLDNSVKSVEQAIIAHQRHMEEQLATIGQGIEQGNATLKSLQLEQEKVSNGSLWLLGGLLISQASKIAFDVVVSSMVITHQQRTEEQLASINQRIESGNTTTSVLSLGSSLVNLIRDNNNSSNTNSFDIGLNRSFAMPRKGTIIKSFCGLGGTVACLGFPISCPVIRVASVVCNMLPF